MRGDPFHNYLVEKAAAAFVHCGFDVALEHRIPLDDGRVDYVDLLACRGEFSIACEVETSARYVLVNTAKAEALGLILWIVVTNRKVLSNVVRKLATRPDPPKGREIQILLPGEILQVVMNSFPLFSPVNAPGKNRKTN